MTEDIVPGAESSVSGLTGSSAGVESPETGGSKSAGNTWAEIEALAALLEPEAVDPNQLADEGWRERTRNAAIGHAAKVITASDYRRVVEDDDTIERLAIALYSQKHRITVEGARQVWPSMGPHVRRALTDTARAVVRALREET